MVWLPWNAGRALCGLPAATEKVPAQPQLTQDPKSLVHYKTPGVAPPSARVDHGLRELERPRLSIWQWWRYPALVAYKSASPVFDETHTAHSRATATELAQEMVHYTLWGPRKPSWGIEMTLISSFMRNMGTATHLADIVRGRLPVAGPS